MISTLETFWLQFSRVPAAVGQTHEPVKHSGLSRVAGMDNICEVSLAQRSFEGVGEVPGWSTVFPSAHRHLRPFRQTP
jgi:hypothetical protein